MNKRIEIKNGYIKYKITVGPINITLPMSGLFSFDSSNPVLSLSFFKILTGENKLTNGTYFYNEISINKESKINLKEKNIAVIDENDLLLDLNILENIQIFNLNFDKNKLIKCFEKVDFDFSDNEFEKIINTKLALFDELSRIKISLSLKLYFGYQTIIYKKSNLSFETLKLLKKLENEVLIIVFAVDHQYFDKDNVIRSKDNALEFIYSKEGNTEVINKKEVKKKLSLKLLTKNFSLSLKNHAKKITISIFSTSLLAGSVVTIFNSFTNDPIVNQIKECNKAKLNFVKITNSESGYTREGKFVTGVTTFSSEDTKNIKDYFGNYVYYIDTLDIKLDENGSEINSYAIQYDDSLYLKIDSRINDTNKCKNPNSVDEIGISWFVADRLIEEKFNYNNVIIKDINDLIGTKINDKTIVNIYETEDKEIYETNCLKEEISITRSSTGTFLLSESVFVYEDVFSKNAPSSYLIKLTDNQDKDIKFLKSFDEQILGIGRKIDVNSFFRTYMHENNYFSLGNIAYLIFPLLIFITLAITFSYLGFRNLKNYKDEVEYDSKFFLNNGISKTKTYFIKVGSFLAIDLLAFGGTLIISSLFLWILNIAWGNVYSGFTFSPLGLIVGAAITILISLIPYTKRKN